MEDRFSQIRAKARSLNERTRAIQNTNSYARVVGVLSGLGFLIAPGVKPLPTSKVELEEAIAIGRSVEPRVLEVLPAAALSFPRSFLHLDKAPHIFKEVVGALKSGKIGPDFEGISFEKLFEVADRTIKNRKRKVIAERRIPKTFRLSPATIRILVERAKMEGTDHTAYIETLIKKDAGGVG